MKIVKVTYTVRPEFSETNQQNVKTFIEDIRKLNNPAIKYYSFLGADGKTFTHLALYDNEDAQKKFLVLPSFKDFQKKRDASNLEKPEAIEMLELVLSSNDIF